MSQGMGATLEAEEDTPSSELTYLSLHPSNTFPEVEAGLCLSPERTGNMPGI